MYALVRTNFASRWLSLSKAVVNFTKNIQNSLKPSIPSIIRLQLIRMSDNPYLDIKNFVHSSEHTKTHGI
jgi:hypothetical protein